MAEPDPNDLIELSDFELDYGITAGSPDEPYLSRCITRASYDFYTYASRGAFDSALARGFANEFLGVETYSYRFNGYGTPTLKLPVYPVVSVTSLVVDGCTINLSPDGLQYGFVFDEDEIALTRGCFPKGRQNIAVTWTAGYDGVPMDLQGAIGLLVAAWYNRKKHIDVESETVNEQTRKYSGKKYPIEVQQTFDRYRRKFPWV